MKKLVLAIIILLALFCIFRVYSQSNEQSAAVTGIRLQPGLVEVGDGTASLGMSFGVMDGAGGRAGTMSILPLRIVYRSGQDTVTIGLNGLSFLLGGGAVIGTPVSVSAPRSGDLLSVGGKVTVDSRVDGDVWVLGSDLALTPRAEVTGNVVVLGGRIAASPRAVVGGTVTQLPSLKIPFVGILGSQFSAQSLGLAGVALSYVLFGFALFLGSFYLGKHSREIQRSLQSQWRHAVITLAISLVAIPLLAVLLIASLVGVFLLPLLVLVIFLLALDGFLALCVMAGTWLRGSLGKGVADPVYLFTSGLLALFILNAPALVGILLTVVRSSTAARIGMILQALGLGLTAAGLAYGFGASLAFARTKAAR